jgi:putative ABC transport system permease protein
MLDNLIQDPRNREIQPLGSGRYDLNWLEQLQQRPEVSFVIPRTRSIAATIQLKSETAGRILSVEMIPTDQGDPLLADRQTPSQLAEVVLSESAARKLMVSKQDLISGSLARRYQGASERVHLDLRVVDIAQPGSFARDGAFVTLALAEAAEAFRDGHAVPALGWTGDEIEKQRSYPGFRLYTRSIYDVAPLSRALEKLAIEVRTRVADIEIVRNMDRNLTAVFWVIAVIGLLGFSFSLGASLWANVDRKRKELSVLRLVGFRTGDIIWFPVIQSFYTGALGWIAASLVYQGVALTINQMFSDQLNEGEYVCYLLPVHFALALGITLSAALLAAAMAGYRAARIEPSEGLREI